MDANINIAAFDEVDEEAKSGLGTGNLMEPGDKMKNITEFEELIQIISQDIFVMPYGESVRNATTRMLRLVSNTQNEEYKAILLKRGNDPKTVGNLLNNIQKWLDDYSGTNNKLHRQGFYLLIRLSSISKELPSSLFIKVERKESKNPWAYGGFGHLFEGTYMRKKVAIKRPNTDKESLRVAFCREALLWRQLHHDRILPFFGIDKDAYLENPSRIELVSLLMDKGTLNDKIKHDDYDSKKHGWHWLYDVAEGLAYLHANHIVHADISGDNIMIDDNNSAVLGDFGIAVVGNQTTGRGETEESPKKQNWCAPERLAIDLFHQPGVDMREVSSRLKPPVDVYAFGLLCHLVSTKEQPFGGHSIFYHVTRDKGRPKPQVTEEQASLFIRELMQDCWQHHPNDRPTMDVVLSSFANDSLHSSLYLQPEDVLFKARAIADYKAGEKVFEFDFSQGDEFDIYKVYNNWWVTKDRKRVPVSHVEPTLVLFKAKSRYAYSEKRSSEDLTTKENEEISVLAPRGSWWFIMNNEKLIGNVPANCLSMDDIFDSERSYPAVARFTYDVPSNFDEVTHVLPVKRGEKFRVSHVTEEWCLGRPDSGDSTVKLMRTKFLKIPGINQHPDMTENATEYLV